MNQWWILAFVAWTVGVAGIGYNYGHDHAGLACARGVEHQQQVTVTALRGVVANVQKQQTVTQEVDNAYQSKKSDIDSQYAAGASSVQPVSATGNDQHANSRPASGLNAAAPRPFITKIFKLNRQECDDNTQQLISLQDWVRGQQAVK